MKNLLKVFIFIIFTSGSCLGLFAPVIFLGELQGCLVNPVYPIIPKSCSFIESSYVFLLFLCSIYAWLTYFYIGFSWIANEIVSKKWLVRGTISALISLSPLFIFGFDGSFSDFIRSLGVILISTGSAILLSCYLVVYHIKGNKKVMA